MEALILFQVVALLLLALFLAKRWGRSQRRPLLAAIGVNILSENMVSIRTSSEASAQLNQDRLGPLNKISRLPEQKKNSYDPALSNLTEMAATALSARAAYLYIANHKGTWLYPYGCWHKDKVSPLNFKPERFGNGNGVIRVAAQATNGQVFQYSKLQNASNDFGVQDALATPIYGGHTLLGVLLVADKLPPDTFTPDDEQLLADFAADPHNIIIVQNFWAQLQQAERDKELHIIGQISQAIANPAALKDIETVCRAILDQPYLNDLFVFDTIEICLWDETRQILDTVIRLPQNSADEPSAGWYRLGEEYTGWIAQQREALVVPDVKTFTGVIPKADMDNLAFASFLGVPLEAGGRLIGTLELMTHTANTYDATDVPPLEIVASQVSIALENARLVSLTGEQLQQRVDELAGLQRVSNELNSTLDLDKILGQVLQEALQLTQADIGDLYFLDDATGQVAAYQASDSQAPHALTIEHGLIGRVLRSGKSVLIDDISAEEDFDDTGHNIKSTVAVPIYYSGKPVGAIALDSQHPRFFNDNQLRYLEALANHAAVAVGNAQAYQRQILEREQANRRAEQLSRLSEISNTFRTNRPLSDILEDIVFAIAESVGYDVVLVSLTSGKPARLLPQVGAGIPLFQMEQLRAPDEANYVSDLEAVLLDEFRIAQAYFIPAEHMSAWQDRLNIPYIEKEQSPISSQVQPKWMSSFALTEVKQRWNNGDLLLVPLLDTSKATIGLLTVANPIDGLRPDTAAVQTLETFANHAAAAIENAQLFDLEKRRRRLADTLRGVAEAISSQLEFDELLNIILQELGQVIDYDGANVQLFDEDKLVIIGARGWEDTEQVTGLTISMAEIHPSREVIESQEALIINDIHQEYTTSFAEPVYRQARSWMGVPLTYGTNVLGVMVLTKDQPNFFNQQDVKTIVAFANQVAVALQNAQLFEEARQQVRQLAALTEVAQSINRALELNEVLNLVLDAVFDLVGHDQGSIWLIDDQTNTLKMANTKNIPEFLVDLFNESNIPVNSEPFISVIRTRDVIIVQGNAPKDNIANFGLPFPDDVTYVPLQVEDGVIGILAIEAVIHNKNMLQLVKTLADLAAVAIDGARLLSDTRRRAVEMQHLYNLGVEVSGMLEVRQVLRSVISNTLTLTNSHFGAIVLYDEQNDREIVENEAASPKLKTQFGLGTINFAESQQLRKAIHSLWRGFSDQINRTRAPVVYTLPTLEAEKSPTHETLVGIPLRTNLNTARKLGLKAVLGVPVFMQSQIIGAIFVATVEPRHFIEQDIQSLSFVANQASVAVRNAQLVQRLNQLTEELEQRVAQRTEELARTLQDLTEERDRVGTLYQIAKELSSSFDLDRVLNEALNLINRAIGISHGAILLLDKETDLLIYRAALGRNKPLPRGGIKTPYTTGYGLAGMVVEKRTARLVNDLSEEPDWVTTNSDQADERRAALAVPLGTGEEVLGVLMMFHPEPGFFTDDHLQLVSAASAQIATAVNNAELYQLITDQAQRLGVLYRQQASEAAKNAAILKGITDGVLVLDAQRKIVLVNPKAAEILNLRAKEVENAPLHQLLGRSESPIEIELSELLYENLARALTQIEAGDLDAQFTIEAGAKVVMVSLAPVALGPEERPSTVAVLRDISKEAEIERLKNEFISTVSHELRTPMTSIKGYSDLLLSGNIQIGELNQTQHRFVKVIQSNANRLTELVNDILEISRIETGRIKLDFGSLNIIEIINDVAVSFEGQMVKKTLNLKLHLPDQLPPVYADRARLTQVLVNLIGNAWQYTPEGGNVDVYARQMGNFIQVDVSDTGIGIPEKDIPYLFDRFFRSERTEVQVVDGTGLGLSITKSFVEMLGGQIWLKSMLDVGTTFSFTVPMVEVANPAVLPKRDPIASRNQVLFATSQADIVAIVEPALEAADLNLTVVETATAAAHFIQESTSILRAIIVDAGQPDLPDLLAEVSTALAEMRVPVMLASFIKDSDGARLQVHVVGGLSPESEAHSVARAVKRVLGGVTDRLQTKSLNTRMAAHRVLIIEFDRSISSRLREILLTSGYEAMVAHNSRQGLDMAFGNLPDLILLDIGMPQIQQQSLVAQLREDEETQHIPVVLLVSSFDDTSVSSQRLLIWGYKHWRRDNTVLSGQELAAELSAMKTGFLTPF
jgi:GAF domain-containing protein/nitrogen-specific signal transduction histidine kinase/CheY-like chemotaxis protein